MTPRLGCAVAAALAACAGLRADTLRGPSPSSVLAVMEKAADWQLSHPSTHPETDWTQAAGDAGMMALAGISGSAKYEEAMIAMAGRNGWKPGPRPYHADDQAVGQTYAELYLRHREPAMIGPLRERLDAILAKPPAVRTLEFNRGGATDLWSWCDSLFMAPPAWMRMYAATGEAKYMDYAVANWWRTTDFLYDKDEHLYYRDSTYFGKREANGKKVFWSRGNGWVMAGLARVLQDLPSNHPDRPRLEALFRDMAGKVLACQQPDGLWRASLLDPARYPVRETSGSGFFAYALAWGINEGLLSDDDYAPAVLRAWDALVSCVGPDGRLSHVQPIGADPRLFAESSTEVYGVGAFLLAGSEIYKRSALEATREAGHPAVRVTVTNPSPFYRMRETVEFASPDINPKAAAVLDGSSARVLDSQAFKEDTGAVTLFQADLAPGASKTFLVVPSAALPAAPSPLVKTYARQVTERYGDVAWESDRIAHRMYSVALIKGEGTVSSGIDVWVKRTRNLVINEWYKRPNYHEDDGDGLDDYQVGRSRGCGGLGIWSGGRLLVSSNFASARILSTGPIRSEFELNYDAWDGGGRKVTESKHITIDAGSNMSHATIFLQSDPDGPLTVGIGIARRADPAAVEDGDAAHGWMTYWQAPDRDRGCIGCAVVLAPGTQGQFAEDDASVPMVPPEKRLIPGSEGIPPIGNRLILTTVQSGQLLEYYFGAGWSKSGDFPDAAAWSAYVRRFSEGLAQPVEVK